MRPKHCWVGPSMAHLGGTEALNALQTLFEGTLPLINSFRGSATWSLTILCSPLFLPNNRMLAAHRLRLLRRRLVKDSILFQKYSAFVVNLLDKAYARKVPDNQICAQARLPGSCRTTQCFIQRNPGKLEWCSTVQRSIRGVS